jgi:hypothetical protein
MILKFEVHSCWFKSFQMHLKSVFLPHKNTYPFSLFGPFLHFLFEWLLNLVSPYMLIQSQSYNYAS